MKKPNLGKLVASKLKEVSLASKLGVSGPARTRFAPSPTGYVHLGSLRTALYNYLLAKSTGGSFILRLEDTDQTRIKEDAEENIYDSLKWAKILWDEGPVKQSDRRALYREKAQQLLDHGLAYRCFCSKERLDNLSQTARKLWPPSTASYDRKCIHLTAEEGDQKVKQGENYVVRFKSPEKWPKFDDLLHGTVESLTQINELDRRYDDFVLLKSDGMPTYHFANVVDDTDMKITHVLRGEEWMSSTPKHIALYSAFGCQPPHFVHIPLLTGEGGKKLSKRKGAHGIIDLAHSPEYILPEALVNFAALLGWSSAKSRSVSRGESVSDVMDLVEMAGKFSLEGLTKGNVQVDYSKLNYLNKKHFEKLLKTDFMEAVKRCQQAYPSKSLAETAELLKILKSHVSCVADYVSLIRGLVMEPKYEKLPEDTEFTKTVVRNALQLVSSSKWDPLQVMNSIVAQHSKKANHSMRFALLDGRSGIAIIEALKILGPDLSLRRLQICAERLG